MTEWNEYKHHEPKRILDYLPPTAFLKTPLLTLSLHPNRTTQPMHTPHTHSTLHPLLICTIVYSSVPYKN